MHTYLCRQHTFKSLCWEYTHCMSVRYEQNPCGMPVDKSESSWLMVFDFDKLKSVNVSAWVSRETLKVDRFERITAWFTISNLYLKSKNTAQTTSPLTNNDLTFSKKMQLAISIEYLVLDTNCTGAVKMCYFSGGKQLHFKQY